MNDWIGPSTWLFHFKKPIATADLSMSNFRSIDEIFAGIRFDNTKQNSNRNFKRTRREKNSQKWKEANETRSLVAVDFLRIFHNVKCDEF